ncbi:GFA family protein [Shewanella cyperi]|uniref:GFA family protein n=1 Tax=Shewanella cyperi TaxID=2814292 RepID=A0A975AJL4_9GAMM|nr:GFA family protein [Shewanella cyperi]QSX29412.1 GFA family protein [Shewanella cyperi]
MPNNVRNTKLSFPITGGCLCGAIRFSISTAPFDADYCHCRRCQQSTGAPVSAWMDFKLEEVSWLKGQVKEFASTDKTFRGFCGDCGSTLSFRHQDYPQYLTLAIAALDNPELISPNYHIYTSSQMPWFNLCDELPRYPGSRNQGNP